MLHLMYKLARDTLRAATCSAAANDRNDQDMNPATKLTDEQIRAICERHDIAYRSHERIATGFSHEVHRLNDDLLIKIFNAPEPRNLETELAILRSGLDFPKPEFVAGQQAGAIQERGYVVMSFVPGFSLGSRWHLATDTQREQLIQAISSALATINHLNPALIKQPSETWEDTISGRVVKLAKSLVAKGTLTAQQEQKVLVAVEANKKYLANSELHPVYWDIHFDNFLVNEQFELQAIIDLENVEYVALDYPLFVIKKLTDEPHKYLREEDEKYADVKDYTRLREWYKKYYPAMFAAENIEERLRLYLLLDTLSLLVDWAHVGELYVKLDKLT